MAKEYEAARAQMAETRAALSEKLETLERKIIHTAHDATSAVAQTVATVKDAVQETVGDIKDAVYETVENVKDTFDLRLQVDRHPWAMVGGSIALGYLGGCLLPYRRVAPPSANGSGLAAPANPAQHTEQRRLHRKDARTGDESPAQPNGQPAHPASEPDWLRLFGPEIAKLRGLAIGMLLSAVGNMVTPAAPPDMQPGLGNVIDGITVKLGGDPVHHALRRAGQAVT